MTLRKLRINLLRLVFIPIIFIAVFVRPGWSLESVTGFVMELGGYIFLLGGLVIRIWCTFYIGNRKSKELITEGPYSICRNPLYTEERALLRDEACKSEEEGGFPASGRAAYEEEIPLIHREREAPKGEILSIRNAEIRDFYYRRHNLYRSRIFS